MLTLIGVSSLANYQAALRSVAYENASDNPFDAARTISFKVDDGGGLVGLGNATVTFTPVNDAPVNTVPASQEVEANTAAAIAGLSIADADAGAGRSRRRCRSPTARSRSRRWAARRSRAAAPPRVTLTGTLAQINTTLGVAATWSTTARTTSSATTR